MADENFDIYDDSISFETNNSVNNRKNEYIYIYCKIIIYFLKKRQIKQMNFLYILYKKLN